MKKFIFSMLILMLAWQPAQGQMNYGQRWYVQNIGSRGSGTPADPLWRFIGEAEDLYSGMGGTSDTGATVYFVDNNTGSDGDDGLSWDNAFLTITAAMLASHNDIAASGQGRAANRNRIYVKGDDFDEDLTDLAQKTDIIGVGSDDGNKGPRLLGNHTIDATASGYNYTGCRFINMTFYNQAASAIFVVPTGHNALEWIGCRFESNSSADATIGIQITACNDTKIIGCDFLNSTSEWSTGAIVFGAGLAQGTCIAGNKIDGDIGIVINSGTTGLNSWIIGNTINAATFCIDENSDKFNIVGNELITETTIAGGTDLNVALCVDNHITGSDGMKRIPLDASVTALATSISNILGFYGVATTTTDTTTTTDDTMTGFHDEQFTTDYVMIITHDAGGSQAAPEGEIVDITNYTATTGVFTHAALTAATTTGDRFLVARREDFLDDMVTLKVSPATGSLASFIAAGPGSSTLGTDVGTDKSLIDVLGSDGVALADDAVSVVGIIGVPTDVDHAVDSTNTTANDDGTMYERLEQIDVDTSAIETSTTTTIPGTITTAQNDLNVITGTAGVLVDDGAITTSTYGTGAITNAVLATDSIGAAELGADSHTSSEMATDSIGADELAADAVAEIAEGILVSETSGSVFYVDTAGDNSDGLSWATAKTTIAGGVGLATASANDKIYVGAGHTLAITGVAGLTMNKIGVQLVGCGLGALQPTITISTSTSADLEIDNSCSFTNFAFDLAETDAMLAPIDVDAADVEFHDCTFTVADGAAQAVTSINLDANADRFLLNNCVFKGGANNGPGSVLTMVGTAPSDVRIIDCWFEADCDNGVIYGSGTPDNLIIQDSHVSNVDAGVSAIVFTSTATGIIKDSTVSTDTYATAIDPGTMEVFNVLWYDSDNPADNVGIPVLAANLSAGVQIGTLDLAAIEAEATDALEAELLNKLLAEVTADVADPVDIVVTEVADNSVLAQVMTQTGDASAFERLTDSLEAIGVSLNTILGSAGEVWYVDDAGTDSTYASSGYGVSWSKPFDTIDYALSQATENIGAVILVQAGHTTTLGATQESYADAGITVIGMGTGEDMCKIVFDDAASSIDITASVRIINMWFESTSIDTTIGLDIEDAADGTSIIGCLFTNDAGFEFVTTIDVKGNADRVTLHKNTIINTTGADALAAIGCTDDVADRLTITDNWIYGSYDSASIWCDQITTLGHIENNTVNNTEAGIHAIEFDTTATGWCIDNTLSGSVLGLILDPGSMQIKGNTQSLTAADSVAYDAPLIPGKTYTFSRASIVTGTTTDLWDIQNGPIEVISFWGLCTVDIGTTGTMEINNDVDLDAPNNDYQLSTAVNIDAVIDGDRIVFANTFGESVLTIQSGNAAGATNAMTPWLVSEGMLETTQNAGSTGNVTWYMTFRTLEANVNVVEQ